MGFKGRVFLKAAESARAWSRMQQAGVKPTPKQVAEHLGYEASVVPHGARRARPEHPVCGLRRRAVERRSGAFLLRHRTADDQGYGLTETAAPFTVCRVDDNVIGTVGQPAPGCSARISEERRAAAQGRERVSGGYHNLPDKTAEVLTEDGWFRTGDLGSIDDEGRITITGRKKDIIITRPAARTCHRFRWNTR